MPIYEWVCRECGTEEERMMTMHESDRPQFCERCGSQLDYKFARPAWFKSGRFGKAGGISGQG